eukprot:scaffold145337_cov18-Prasinocladus_malaysianus.AAC.1
MAISDKSHPHGAMSILYVEASPYRRTQQEICTNMFGSSRQSNYMFMQAMQRALQPIGMTVKYVDKDAGEWSVSDGKSLTRFYVSQPALDLKPTFQSFCS